MLLVPKQLQRAGMTGNVPYYGGRFTPAQAYAASHRSRPAGSAPPAAGAPSPPRGRGGTSARGESVPPTAVSRADTLSALRHLLDTGVITPEEYEELRSRETG